MELIGDDRVPLERARLEAAGAHPFASPRSAQLAVDDGCAQHGVLHRNDGERAGRAGRHTRGVVTRDAGPMPVDVEERGPRRHTCAVVELEDRIHRAGLGTLTAPGAREQEGDLGQRARRSRDMRRHPARHIVYRDLAGDTDRLTGAGQAEAEQAAFGEWFVVGHVASLKRTTGFVASGPARVQPLGLARRVTVGDCCQMSTSPQPADGKLLVLLPGFCGAVATTFMAGVALVRAGAGRPIGSLSQMQTIRLGARSENRMPRIRDFVPLADLSQVCFAGWDIHDESAYDALLRNRVLRREDTDVCREEMSALRPMPAAFDPTWVRRLDGPHKKTVTSKRALVEALREDIRSAIADADATRAVMIWCGSTEVHQHATAAHLDSDAFEEALDRDDPSIPPSQLYAYAAIAEGIPYANGAPNLSADVPALEHLAEARGVPIAGKDFKTGQTMMKTVLAPGFKARMLGVRGWFSTNILGNRDGEVLDDPGSFRAKEVTKSGVLDTIFQPDVYPELYGDLFHKVRIEYYPPRGDAKEGWDNIDLVGWLDYPMQIKVDFLCRDSILAAPVVLDLALFLDLAARASLSGVQEWLSFYFKSPQTAPGHVTEHDLFIQHFRLKNTLRLIGGEEPLTHLDERVSGQE